jgi:FkbM family methyltransferase
VEHGSASIGILDAKERYIVHETIVSRDDLRTNVSLTVPSFDRRGRLVVRSCTEAEAIVRMRILGVRARDADSTSAAAAAVDRFLDAASELLSHRPLGANTIKSAQTAAQGLIRDVAGIWNIYPLGPEDQTLSRVVQNLSDQVLAALAGQLTLPASAERYPAWKFDMALEQPAPDTQLRVAVWKEIKARQLPDQIVIPWLEGTKARMPLRSDLSFPLFTTGTFEPNLCAVLTELIRPGDVVVDVGANEGLHTLLAAARVGPKGLVIAVEPSRRELARLRENVGLNELQARIVIVEQALGGASGIASFAIAQPEHGGQNAFVELMNDAVQVDDVLPTAVVTLDMLADRVGRRMDMIKIDVEGAELEVLRGGSRVLHDHRPIWAIEVGRTGDPTDGTVEAMLRNADYVLFGIDDVNATVHRMDRGARLPQFENVIAVPAESLAIRWPDAPKN